MFVCTGPNVNTLTFPYSMLSLVPFSCFLVLAGNGIATSSRVDLSLLSEVLEVVKLAVDQSPVARKTYEMCESFYRIVDRIVPANLNQPSALLFPPSRQEDRSAGGMDPHTVSASDAFDAPLLSDLPMLQQDWDNFMTEFDFGMDGVGFGALASDMEPFIVGSGTYGA
jgi:hypothetical protein